MGTKAPDSRSQRLRALAKSGIAAGLYRSGVGQLAGSWRGLNRQPLVIGYHRVVSDFQRCAKTSIDAMLISTETFEAQLDWLARRYQFVALDELAQMLAGGQPVPRKVAAITFDDGYRDVYDHAFPILMRKGIPFAVFVVTDLVGTARWQVHDEVHFLLTRVFEGPEAVRQDVFTEASAGLPESARQRARECLGRADNAFVATRALLEVLERDEIKALNAALRDLVAAPGDAPRDMQSLDWEMLEEMVARGVTIGSHTCSHALLTREPPARVRAEVRNSRELLERRLGQPVRHFVYPDGRFDALSVAAVAEAGYLTAYTTCRHRDPRFPMLTLPRRLLWENSCRDAAGAFSSAVMHCQVNGVFDAADRCSIQHEARAGATQDDHVDSLG